MFDFTLSSAFGIALRPQRGPNITNIAILLMHYCIIQSLVHLVTSGGKRGKLITAISSEGAICPLDSSNHID